MPERRNSTSERVSVQERCGRAFKEIFGAACQRLEKDGREVFVEPKESFNSKSDKKLDLIHPENPSELLRLESSEYADFSLFRISSYVRPNSLGETGNFHMTYSLVTTGRAVNDSGKETWELSSNMSDSRVLASNPEDLERVTHRLIDSIHNWQVKPLDQE
jgi:hypothetical protein